MRNHIAVEDVEADHWVAWVLELPGCYSSGTTMDQAIDRVPEQIRTWQAWLTGHGLPMEPTVDISVNVVEVFRSYFSEPGYLVNAFFEDDRRPLSREEVANGVGVLRQTQADLLVAVAGTGATYLTRTIEVADGRSVTEILSHLATAESWYLSRLGLSNNVAALPGEPLARLEVIRRYTVDMLPQLAGDDRVVELRGERWSPRKVLRRIAWHERDHTQQIATLR